MPTRDGAWPDGYPCWVDLGSSDRLGAWDFYTTLMGWQIRDTGAETGHYGVARVDGHAVGAIGQAAPGRPTAWLIFFATSDVDATALAVAAAEGTLLVRPGNVREPGRMAIAVDPACAAFGLRQAKGTPGFGLTGDPGAPTWFELQTPDLARAQAFSSEAFGWPHVPIGGGMAYSTVPGTCRTA